MKRFIIVLICCSCCCWSCGLYGKYKPEVQAQADSVCVPGWEDIFTDSLLVGYINTALSNNTDYSVALLRCEQAQANMSAARMAFLPSVVLDPNTCMDSYTQNRLYAYGASAGWEIDLFGKKLNGSRIAREQLLQSEAYARAVRSALIANVAQTYYTLEMLDSQLRIGQGMLECWTQTENALMALKENAGQADERAVLQARAQKLRMESSVLGLKRSVFQTERTMISILGVQTDSISRGNLSDASVSASFFADIPLTAISNRPDVRQSEHALAEAYYATNLSRSYFFPSVCLGGTAGWVNNLGKVMLVDPSTWVFSALVSITEPLLNEGKNVAGLKRAKAQQEIARKEFGQTLLDAGNEVLGAQVALATASAQREKDTQRAVLLEQNRQKTDLLMTYGSATFLDVLSANEQYLSACQAKTESKYGELAATIQLFHALGGE